MLGLSELKNSGRSCENALSEMKQDIRSDLGPDNAKRQFRPKNITNIDHLMTLAGYSEVVEKFLRCELSGVGRRWKGFSRQLQRL